MINILEKYLAQKGIVLQSEFRFCKRRWKLDYYFKYEYGYSENEIGIEVEGGVFVQGRHTRGKGYVNDMEKYNEAQLMGIKVFRFTWDQIEKNKEIELVDRLGIHWQRRND